MYNSNTLLIFWYRFRRMVCEAPVHIKTYSYLLRIYWAMNCSCRLCWQWSWQSSQVSPTAILTLPVARSAPLVAKPTLSAHRKHTSLWPPSISSLERTTIYSPSSATIQLTTLYTAITHLTVQGTFIILPTIMLSKFSLPPGLQLQRIITQLYITEYAYVRAHQGRVSHDIQVSSL